MNFIEQMVGAMRTLAAPTPEQPETQNEVVEEVAENSIQPEQEQITDVEMSEGEDTFGALESPEQKSYSQEEVEKIISEREKEWKQEHLNELSKDEQIEQLKAELFKRDLKEKIYNRLEEKELSHTLGDVIHITDEKETMERLEKAIAVVTQMVHDRVKERLRGKTPEGLGVAAGLMNQYKDKFASTLCTAMDDKY